MEIYLIRHGETEANLDASKPPILTRRGQEQVNLLADIFKEEKVGLIISSDIERALLTAQAIKEKNSKNVELEVTPELREIYRLIVGGSPKEGTRPNRFEEDLERANLFWDRLISLNKEKVLVVSHGNIMRFLVAKALDIAPVKSKNIILDPTSVSLLQIEDGNISIKYLNDMNHLHEKYNVKTIHVE